MRKEGLAFSLAAFLSLAPGGRQAVQAMTLPLMLAGCNQGPGYDECTKSTSYDKSLVVTNAQFEDIASACNLYLVTWDAFHHPIISQECADEIKSVLPIDPEWEDNDDETAQGVLNTVIRGFHYLLFFPLADDQTMMGIEDYYCDSIYQGFLHAQKKSAVLTARVLSRSGYQNSLSQMNTGLFRFIVERLDFLVYDPVKVHKKEALAYESGGDMIFGSDIEKFSPIDTAVIIIHESRHNNRGFSDLADHVPCYNSDNVDAEDGEQACDDSFFGAFGAGLSYLDALAKGSSYLTLDNGTSILSDTYQISYLIQGACEIVNGGINEPGPELSDIFGDYDCFHNTNTATDEEIFDRLYGR
ncbi:MAG: hypothetical protein HY547_04160 [Elusimicrobia bacterium]|nr:hypothetical protein [Elusimicrobiota bacterium]